MIEFNPKQAQLVAKLKAGTLPRLNILEGAVRSGKTWISLIVFALWVATMPPTATFLMVAKTLTSLKRNCLELLQGLVGEDNFSYNLSQKQGQLFGRTVYLEGVNDVRAEGKIRGMTLTGCYCDEATLFTEDFWTMMLSRLSMPGAKLFASTNPDNPNHFIKKKYIDRAEELDMLVMRFNIYDNPTLDPIYIENLKKEYTGVFFRRFILGEWCVADGGCYPKFADNPEPFLVDELPEHARFISIGIDWGGNRSLTTFVATAIHGDFNSLTVIKDHFIPGRKGEIDADIVNSEFIRFVTELKTEYKLPVRYVFADSEGQYLINGLRRACAPLGLQVGESKKVEIVQRIIATNSLMNANRLKIMRNCENVQNALMCAVWNPKAAEKGKDERLDDHTSDIDTLDAFEYSFERFLSKLTPRLKLNK